MILVEKISTVAELLLNAATSRGNAPFNDFHSLFTSSTSTTDKYDTLEAASRALCPPSIAIFGAVLAKKDTKCPGDGFFDAFKNMRPNEYQTHAGVCHTTELTIEQMMAITLEERERVYEHAESNF